MQGETEEARAGAPETPGENGAEEGAEEEKKPVPCAQVMPGETEEA